MKARPDLDVFTPDIESIFAEITLPSHGVILVGAVYRPPNSNFEAFLEHLIGILMQVNREKKRSYLMGDYNIDLSPTHPTPISDTFLDTMYSWSFIPLIDNVTRASGDSNSLIDNIFTNNLSTMHESAVLIADISDHYPLLLFSDLPFHDSLNTKIQSRNFCDANKLKFRTDLQNEQWDAVLRESSPDAAYTIFLNIIKTHYNNSFPIRETSASKPKSNPWMTRALKQSIIHKNKLYVLYKKRPSLHNEIAYKRSKNKVRAEIAAAKKNYYHNLIERNKHHMKNLWSILKDLIGSDSRSSVAKEFDVGGTLTSDKTLISNGLNEYFVNVGPSLARDIPTNNIDPLSFLQGDFPNSLFLDPVTILEVSNCLAKLKSSSAAGHDDLKPDIMQSVSELISCPLAHIMNTIFQSCSIPSDFKFAVVTPIHKGGDTAVFHNYRPISVLPVFSKVFERILHNRLYNFFQSYSVLCDQQFGFRKGYSTDMALLTAVDQITASLDTGHNVVGLFLDLRKAFDTVDFEILLRKLSFYGVRGNPLSLCRNYLSGRSQSVLYAGVRSDVLPVTCGVPQGSILGPLLFLVYINDMINSLTVSQPILYADDTNIFLTGRDLTSMTHTFNTELTHLNQWFTANRLSLNISKTHAMLFTLNTHLSSQTLELCIHQTPIDTVTHS